MESILKLLSASVPRYTSYPTAPHFHAGIDAAQYSDWLEALPSDKPLSLYFHIPFCDTLCWFCGCHTTAVNGYAPVREYRALLLEEIRLVAAALKKPHTACHIHWGGGSPTILTSDDIARLDETTRSNFDVAPGSDFSVEIDPRGLSEGTVHALKIAGVTRASLGLQDCDPVVQGAINRIQSDEETAFAVSLLRGADIASLNLDLVYGLPHQTWRAGKRRWTSLFRLTLIALRSSAMHMFLSSRSTRLLFAKKPFLILSYAFAWRSWRAKFSVRMAMSLLGWITLPSPMTPWRAPPRAAPSRGIFRAIRRIPRPA